MQLKHFDTSDRVILKRYVILLKILIKTGTFTQLFLHLIYTTNKENIYDNVQKTRNAVRIGGKLSSFSKIKQDWNRATPYH